jgi:hypothetical protein
MCFTIAPQCVVDKRAIVIGIDLQDRKRKLPITNLEGFHDEGVTLG